MKNQNVLGLVLAGWALASAGVQAVPHIPEKSGWGGHINLGVGVGTSESNMIDGVGSIDLGKDPVSSLEDSPDSEDFVVPAIHFEVAYTFAENRTQIYLGNQVVDYLSFDLETTLETHLGIRQEVPGVAVVDISLAASSVPIDVWKDPYIVDSPRGDTERTTSGLHFAFDQLFGSGFQLEWSATEIELDDERSGEGLGLDGADQRLLRRTGNVYRLDLSYDWRINQRNRIEPVLGWVDFDLDGDAMAEDGPALAVRHLYEIDRWYIVSQLYYQDLESDSRNPVFGRVRQLETLGASFTLFYSEPFGLDRWKATASLGYQEDDSNIDFYDSSFGLFSLGMFYRFD